MFQSPMELNVFSNGKNPVQPSCTLGFQSPMELNVFSNIEFLRHRIANVTSFNLQWSLMSLVMFLRSDFRQ